MRTLPAEPGTRNSSRLGRGSNWARAGAALVDALITGFIAAVWFNGFRDSFVSSPRGAAAQFGTLAIFLLLPGYQGISGLIWEGRYKLVRRHEEPDLLFDLELDPWESENVLDDHPGIAARLAELLTAELARP